MTLAHEAKSESPWAIGGLVALSFVLMVLLLSLPLLVRTFLFQPFNIPSTSMVPTFLLGDYFFVSKYAYGFPAPLSSGRILGSEPARGDVVAFLLPKDTSTVFHQARGGIAWRSHSNEARVASHQRCSRSARASGRFRWPGSLWIGCSGQYEALARNPAERREP